MLNSSRAPSWRGWLGLGLAAILGMALLLYFMRAGIGIRGDSVRYVMGARNFLAGDGFSRTSGGGELYSETGFAPLLAFVLAGMGWLRIDMFAGARILNAILFGFNGFLVGAIVLRWTRSSIAALMAATLFLLAPSIIEWHGWMMTEALFISLTLVSIFALVRGLDTDRDRLLIASGLLAGVSALARYVGLAMAPAGALVILLLHRRTWRERLIAAAGFSALAVAPFVLWMVRNQMVGGSGLANREILVHAIRPDLLRVALFEAASWALPEAVLAPRAIRALVAIAVLGIGPVAYFLRGPLRKRAGGTGASVDFAALPWLAAFYLGSYFVVLILNSVFLDAGTTDSAAIRYLTPFFAVLVILEVGTYTRLVLAARRRRLAASCGILTTAILIALYSQQSLSLVQASTLSLGFTGIRERWAPAAADLRELAGEAPIITNNPEMLYYLMDRPAYTMPIQFDPYRQEVRADFAEQMQLARERLQGGSVLVIFEPPNEDQSQVLALLDLVQVGVHEGVTVYAYPMQAVDPGG